VHYSHVRGAHSHTQYVNNGGLGLGQSAGTTGEEQTTSEISSTGKVKRTARSERPAQNAVQSCWLKTHGLFSNILALLPPFPPLPTRLTLASQGSEAGQHAADGGLATQADGLRGGEGGELEPDYDGIVWWP